MSILMIIEHIRIYIYIYIYIYIKWTFNIRIDIDSVRNISKFYYHINYKI